MQTTMDMNAATMRCGSTFPAVSHESGSRAKAASEPSGEGTPQRFAEVLPLAQAALEQQSKSKEETATQDAVEGESGGVQVDGEAPSQPDHPAQQQGEMGLVNPEAMGWLFAEVVQPVIQPQTAESVGFAQAAAERVVMPQQGAKPTTDASLVLPQQPRQALAGEQHVSTPLGAGADIGASGVVAAGATTLGKQEAPSSIGIMGGQTSPAPQTAQETIAANTSQVVQPTPPGTQVGQTDVRVDTKNGGIQSPAVHEAVDSISQAKGPETPAAPQAASGSRPSLGVEKTGQALEKPQSVNPQTTATPEMTVTSEKNAQEQGITLDKPQSGASRRPEVISSESLKTEPAQSGGTVAGSKDAATVPAHQSVSVGGESAGYSQRLVTQVQAQPTPTQVSTDTAAARAPIQSIGEQILDSVRASALRGDRQVFVRLNPPELGTVLVRFQQQGEHLIGTLEVSSRETRREIEQALPQVARTLQEAGVQVRRLEVVASDQPERDMSREHLTQDSSSQHEGAGQGREHSHASSPMRWSQGMGERDATRRAVSAAESQAAAEQGRINLLL